MAGLPAILLADYPLGFRTASKYWGVCSSDRVDRRTARNPCTVPATVLNWKACLSCT